MVFIGYGKNRPTESKLFGKEAFIKMVKNLFQNG